MMQTGDAMYRLIEELYPICRSITGDGFRKTLARIGDYFPLDVHEVPSGTKVFDWTVPKEWNIRDAYVKNAAGNRVIDFRRSNLHVLNYSVPVNRRMGLDELRSHLFTDPEHPDWIPYRASYYDETWGFCLAHRTLETLDEGEYEVRIDATLEPGHLTYGEYFLSGATSQEVLISCHSCHPSLCNDNLSGIALAVALASYVRELPTRKYGYRFLFIPGTIGSITWLARNEDAAGRVKAGLVLSCVGDSGPSSYKRSRRGDHLIDRAVVHVLQQSGDEFRILDFVPYGYDERQYCSPGFDLPVGCFMRTPNGEYPEYHTSADNLDLVQPAALEDSLNKLTRVVEVLEHDNRYVNLNPKCEPQLGRRGLYKGVTGRHQLPGFELALLWVLNLSDGEHSLLDIAERASIRFTVVRQAADALAAAGLLASRATDEASAPSPNGTKPASVGASALSGLPPREVG